MYWVRPSVVAILVSSTRSSHTFDESWNLRKPPAAWSIAIVHLLSLGGLLLMSFIIKFRSAPCCFVLLTQGWGRLETRPLVAPGSSPELFAFTMSVPPWLNKFVENRRQKRPYISIHWLMIAFNTRNSNLGPLLEGLCSSNPCRFEFSVFWVFAGSNQRPRD